MEHSQSKIRNFTISCMFDRAKDQVTSVLQEHDTEEIGRNFEQKTKDLLKNEIGGFKLLSIQFIQLTV